MNCNACLEPIDRNWGYYLLRGKPYCPECYQKPENGDEMARMAHLVRPDDLEKQENLLEAFRAFQKQNPVSMHRR